MKRGCPLCESYSQRIVLDLAPTPLGDRFMQTSKSARNQPLYPLTVGRCEECAHCFLIAFIESDEIFDHYPFGTDISFTEVAFNSVIAKATLASISSLVSCFGI